MPESRYDVLAVADPEPDERFRGVRRQVGEADVVALEARTARLRALDHRYGGGRCVDEVVSRLPTALVLLGVPAADRIGGALHTAVADLHNLAGWTCFDTGRTGEALRHFRTALVVAAAGGDQELVSNVHYRLGRVHLHHDAPRSALAEFQTAERTARASGSAITQAVVAANQAWAHAKTGSAREANALLAEAAHHHARARGVPVPGWVAFFTEVELSALGGLVHTELALTRTPVAVHRAVPLLTAAVEGYAADMTRSRTFSLISLAVCHLLDGRLDAGTRLGNDALDLCDALESARTTTRLRPLQDVARQHSAHRDARALLERIDRFREVDPAPGWPATHLPSW